MNRDYKGIFAVRAAAILTNSYVAGTVIGPQSAIGVGDADVHNQNQLIIYIDFTLGSLTDGRIKVEFAHDGSDYYQESSSSISSGTDTVSVVEHKFTATGKYRLAIPIKDAWIKISSIGTGTVTNSSMKVSAILGTV